LGPWFWDGPIWEKMEKTKRWRDFEKEKKNHPENVCELPEK
jgi:hypothetical protein